jgi:branched-chain amino acid transport system permease protein
MFRFEELADILVNGMGIAAGLFIVSSGLTVIFGVSRVYNFAHGSLFMLGAYFAYSITTALPSGPLWFILGIILAALCVGVVGLVIELLVMRRLYTVPHHLQIIATFGIFLIVRDVALSVWGPIQLVTEPVPVLSDPLRIFGLYIPSYYLLMVAVAGLIFAILTYVFHRTRWGTLIRAAIEDREMVSALGVNQSVLFTSVFVLSAMLAGLAGGLETLRVSASLDMDIRLLIDAFAVVVIGGMGSVGGSLVAAILVGLLTATGTTYFSELSMALVFITMAVVLLVRPQGFFGKPMGGGAEEHAADETVLKPAGTTAGTLWVVVIALMAAAPLFIGAYGLASLSEILIWIFFAWTFYLLAGPGGMVSLGHAAFFGVGLYVPALLYTYYDTSMLTGLIVGPVAAAFAAAIAAFATARLKGIYFAMLTLALAQILWSVVYQWVELTNGETGLIGIWPDAWASDPRAFYYLTLCVAVFGIILMRRIVFSPFGYALRATRDSAGRADAIGLNIFWLRWTALVIAGALAGLAGVLMLYLKGGAFPTFMDMHISLDVFIMALLGGLSSLSGPVIGATVYQLLKTTLQTNYEHWNLLLGILLIALALFMPDGVSGLVRSLRARLSRRQVAGLATPQTTAQSTAGGH